MALTKYDVKFWFYVLTYNTFKTQPTKSEYFLNKTMSDCDYTIKYKESNIIYPGTPAGRVIPDDMVEFQRMILHKALDLQKNKTDKKFVTELLEIVKIYDEKYNEKNLKTEEREKARIARDTYKWVLNINKKLPVEIIRESKNDIKR